MQQQLGEEQYNYMSMLKYNNSTINDWNYDSSNINKVYYGVTNASRLPSGYTEVEYVENTGNSTVNLGIQLMKNANDTFEVVLDNEMIYDSNGGQHQTFLTCCAEIAPYYNGWYCRFDGYSSTVVIGGNVGTLTTGRTLVSGSTYHTTINGTTESNRAQDFPLNLFSSLDSTKTPWRFCKGKLYNMTVTYNNELVRNLVPCKNSLNVAGLYDLVNDVFYSSESGYDELVASNPIISGGKVGKVVYQKITNETPPPLYDAEIEYLENNITDGSQYINTNQYLNPNSFEIGYEINSPNFFWGYVHQGIGSGTWIGIENNTVFFGNFNNKFTATTSSTENVVIYAKSGVTINGNSYTSKSFSLGTDSINSNPLYIFGRYDFKEHNIDTNASAKLKSFYLKVNDELVLDLIPVRVGQVGYMYDKISGQLFGNVGTGNFILGADK